jgi:hypothetical protein
MKGANAPHTLGGEAAPLLNPYQDWDPWAGGFDPAQQGMNVSHALGEQAYRTLRGQGLSEEQAVAVLQHRGTRQSRSGAALWDPTRLQQRPSYSGPAAWSFEAGNGLTAEEAIQAKASERRQVQKRNAELNARRMGEVTSLEAGPGLLGAGAMAGVTPQLPPALVAGRPIGVDDGLGFDPLALATAGANPYKIESSLSSPVSQPQRQSSGGVSLDPLSAGMAAVDMATSVLPLAGGQSTVPPAPSLTPQAVVARTGLTRDSIEAAIGRRTPAPADIAPDVAPVPNVSGGGPGTSSAKGADTIARQAAKRGGNELLGNLDSFLTNPAGASGKAAEGGLRNVSAALHRRGMPGLAGMAKSLAPVARWGVPAAALAGTTVLPAAFGAMEGNEKAGTAGAVLQGGSALAGAAIGQALIPIPGVGAVIGSMAGNAIGGGLASGAASVVEKAQAGDTGFMGNIGRALDPFVDTAFEKEQKAVLQQMNSPAMQLIQEQQRTREAQARASQARQVLMQSYMQVI